jgi:hypothetical protein
LEVEDEEDKEAAALRRALMGMSRYDRARVKEEDKYYDGLDASATAKYFHPDYPVDLKLRKICNPKIRTKRRTIDNFKTEPIARFSPVSSKDNLVKNPTPKPPIKSKLATDAGPLGAVEEDDEEEEEEVPEEVCAPRLAFRDLPPIVSVNDEVVINYMDSHNIQMMFEYFLGLVLIEQPQDPFAFMVNVANQLINARSDYEAFHKLPKLLGAVHLEALFRIYDRVGTGFISHDQYKSAMESIGVISYNATPKGHVANQISLDTFMQESNSSIDQVLRSFMFERSEADFSMKC